MDDYVKEMNRVIEVDTRVVKDSDKSPYANIDQEDNNNPEGVASLQPLANVIVSKIVNFETGTLNKDERNSES